MMGKLHVEKTSESPNLPWELRYKWGASNHLLLSRHADGESALERLREIDSTWEARL